MVKWWSNSFKDLKPFDIISYDNLVERCQSAMRFVDKHQYDKQKSEGRAFVCIKSETLHDPEVKKFHEKYNNSNCPIPTKTQIVLRQYSPEYNRPEYSTEENKYIFEGQTSNINSRDGFIVPGISTKPIESYYLEPKRAGAITGEWIYLTIPYSYISQYMELSINKAPLTAAKHFIKEVEENIGWEDENELRKLVDIYDSKYPNWSHDFPIKSYIQCKKDGILFPIIWWHPRRILTEGTHRVVMAGLNKMDVPFILPVDGRNNLKWYAMSKDKLFLIDNTYQYLCLEIDRVNQKLNISFSKQDDWAEKKNSNMLLWTS